jgi:malonate-semialdehyde dehydrogenase (acetylating)/methylmalonate-semialdehyde dehydrogenase
MTDTAQSTFNLLEPLKQNYGTVRNFINGEWVEAKTDRYLDVINPADGISIAKVPMTTKAETDRAIQAAHDAYWDWRSTPPIVRARYLFKIKALLDRHHEEIARITTQEHGKAIDEARGETLRSIENVETAAGITSVMMGYNLD